MSVRLAELIVHLQNIQDDLGEIDPEVRLAIQPRWAFEHSIGDLNDIIVVDLKETDPDNYDEPEDKAAAAAEEPEHIVYIGEGTQLGYLPGVVSKALSWGR